MKQNKFVQQDSKEPSMQLTNKGLKVKCQKHMKPIIGLNIGLNQPLDNRIICDECPNINQKIISLHFAEKCLYNWHQEEKEQIIRELKDIEGYIKYFKQVGSYNLTTEIRMQIEKIQTKHREYKKTLTSPQQSKFSQFFNTITSQEIISEEYLSDLALFFSQQIIEDHGIYLKEQALHYFQDDYLILTNINKTIDQKRIELQLNSNPSDQFSQDQQFKSAEEINNLNNLKEQFRYTQQHLLCGQNDICALSYDNKFLATATNLSHAITIWNFEEQTKIKQLESPNSVRFFEFSQNSRFLAVGQGNKNEDSSIVIFDLISDFRWPIIRIPELHLNRLYTSGIRFTKDSNYLICKVECNLKIWDIKQETEVYSRLFSSLIVDFLISDNSDLIVCGCYNGQVYLFKSKTLSKLQIVSHWRAGGYINWITITPNSQQIITLQNGYKVKIWSTKLLGKKMKTFSVKDDDNGDYDSHLIVTTRIGLNGQILMLQYKYKLNIWHIETSQLLTKIGIYESQLGHKPMNTTSDMRYFMARYTHKQRVVKFYKRIEW